MLKTPLLVSLALAALVVAPRIAEAKGWEEVHQTSDDVRVTVGPDGMATVQHHLRFRIVAGHFKTLDFAGIDPHAELVAESTLLPEKGVEIPARIEANPKTPGAVRIIQKLMIYFLNDGLHSHSSQICFLKILYSAIPINRARFAFKY